MYFIHVLIEETWYLVYSLKVITFAQKQLKKRLNYTNIKSYYTYMSIYNI